MTTPVSSKTRFDPTATASSELVVAPENLPEGFVPIPAGEVYDVTTDLAEPVPVTVCIEPQGEAPHWKTPLRILHEEDGLFVDRTSYTDLTTGTVCAEVDGLSLFAVGYFERAEEEDDDDDDEGEDHE